ncbi:hypothetical protein HZH68_002472 [Vespula germanica]|uniref:Uncharacterized protein n=1 Tax=Vespula germanica TaxID=30212 RepID=A0A834U144_VESGE|nr:hypothetical protein HZH68_002472 [Vespula germanica]
MAEKEKEVVKKREESNKSDNIKNIISDINNEQIENINENNDVNYTHPIVTEKKGFINLIDYERNYEDIEAYDSEQQSKRQLIQKSKGFINIEDQPEKEENGEKDMEELKETIKKITEKHENDKIDKSIATKKDTDDVKDVSEQTTTSPEEAYVQHMERVIAANTLPSRDMEILQYLYTNYSSDKKQIPITKEIYTKINVDTSEPSESKTDTHDEIKQASINEKEKVILDSSSKDLEKNILRSDIQDTTEDITSTESPISDDKKLESLKRTSSVEKDKIITSTSKTNLVEEINDTSDHKNAKNDKKDIKSLTIESPFSDFTLQTVKLETNLTDLIRQEQILSNISKTLPNSIDPSDTEQVIPLDESKIIVDLPQKKDVIETKETVPSNIHPSDIKTITPLDESKIIVDLPQKKDVIETKGTVPSNIHPSDTKTITPLDESKIIVDLPQKKDVIETKGTVPSSIHPSDIKTITPMNESKIIVDHPQKKDVIETKGTVPSSIHPSDIKTITPMNESKIIVDHPQKKDVMETKETVPSSIHPSDTEEITPLDESEIIIDLPEKKDRTKIKISKPESDESFIRKMLLCHCIDVKMNGNNSNDNNDSNNNVSIIERIRGFFLSLLIDYLVFSQIPNTKNKTLYHY